MSNELSRTDLLVAKKNDQRYEQGIMMSMARYRSRYYFVLAAGLLLFALTLPLSKSAGNVLLSLIFIVGVAGVLLDGDLKEAVFTNIRQPLTPVFFLYFLVAIVGILFTEKYADGFFIAKKFFSLPAIYLIVSVLISSLYGEGKSSQNAEYMLLSFLVGLMILNVIGVVTFLGIIGNRKYATPMFPLNMHHIWFSNINALGLYTAVSFLLFSQWGKAARSRIFLYCCVALGLFCILLSLSRTAWFGIALTSAIMTFLVNKNKRIFFITVLLTAAAGVGAYLFIPLVHERIGLMVSDIALFVAGKTETSLGMRFLMWKAAMMMFLSNPLAGVGTGDYGPTMAAYIAAGQFPDFLLEFNQPHNMYLFALATNGLVGLAALLYVFYRILVFAVPRMLGHEEERLFTFLAAATAVHFLIAGCMDSFFNIQILRYTFVFIMGVCVRSSVVSAQRH
jgi:O-antigen ligase